MPEVCLQPGEIVECDGRDVVGGVGHASFGSGPVCDAPADAHAADGWNLKDRALEAAPNPVRASVERSGFGFINTTCRTMGQLRSRSRRPDSIVDLI